MVLSQHQNNSLTLHPCTLHSHKLTPMELNYNISDKGLLTIKLALEEWRHWLEGSSHPFLIYTDNKNFQYIKEAKQLNPRQARCAMFFSCFHFKISYSIGSMNSCADPLSKMFSPPKDNMLKEPILPIISVCLPNPVESR